MQDKQLPPSESINDTLTGRQMTPLFSTSSAAAQLSDKKKFTAERRDVVAELTMTRVAGIWRGDMHHAEPDLITTRHFCFTGLQFYLQGEIHCLCSFKTRE